MARSDIRKYYKILFPTACLLLIAFSFSLDAFQSDFSAAILWAVLALLIIEVAVLLFKEHQLLWNRLKWYILGALALLTLIS